MTKLINITIFSFIFFYVGSCNSVTEQLPERNGTIDSRDLGENSRATKWEKFSIPIYGGVFATLSDKTLILSFEGIVSINSDGSSEKIPFPQKVNKYSTKDGGVTREKFDSKKEGFEKNNLSDYLCSPEEAISLKRTVFVLANCEHTGQLWKLDFTKQDFEITNLGVAESGAEKVLGPFSFVKTNQKIFSLETTKFGSGFSILENGSKSRKFVWQNKSDKARLVAVSFKNANGWMVLANGEILKSFDDGLNWKHFSNLPEEIRGKITNIHFLNERNGYLVGIDGLIFSTNDAGETWSNEQRGTNASLYKIISNEEVVVVYGAKSTILIKDLKQEKWVNLDLENKGEITDMLIHEKKLLVLQNGDLYSTNWKN